MNKVTNMILKSTKIFYSLGGSPCIVVMGEDWCSRGRGFNSFCKNHIVCLKRPKINEK